jgi:predicted PurR-regulated permease PerM
MSRHGIFLAVTAAIVVVTIALAHAVLLPFVLALVVAYVLLPLVSWVEGRRVSRGLAIVLVYVVVLGTIGVFVRFTAPRLALELGGVRRELPGVARTVRTEWVPYVQGKLRAMGLAEQPSSPLDRDGDGHSDPPAIVARERADGSYAIELQGPLAVHAVHGGGYVVEPLQDRSAGFDLDKAVADVAARSLAYLQQNAVEVFKLGRAIVLGVSRFFFVFGLTLMLAAYTMLTRERIFGFFESLVRPVSRPSWRAFLVRVDRGLSGVVRGQLVICLVNGVLSAIGFALVGLKYWPVLALIATLLSLIPIFGSIVSAIPAVLLGLTQSLGTAVFVLLWIVGIHQLEANFLNPKIMGDAAKIHPLLIVFSLLVGEHFFGVVGALLAVPVMSIAQSLFLHLREELAAQSL